MTPRFPDNGNPNSSFQIQTPLTIINDFKYPTLDLHLQQTLDKRAAKHSGISLYLMRYFKVSLRSSSTYAPEEIPTLGNAALSCRLTRYLSSAVPAFAVLLSVLWSVPTPVVRMNISSTVYQYSAPR